MGRKTLMSERPTREPIAHRGGRQRRDQQQEKCACGASEYTLDWRVPSSILINVVGYALARMFFVDIARVRCSKCARRWMQGGVWARHRHWLIWWLLGLFWPKSHRDKPPKDLNR
jgi:hypothetical protein